MEPCPAAREVTDFQFKLFSSVRVFPAVDCQNFFSNPSNTVTASNKHGLLIVGTPTGFQIINLTRFVSPNATEYLHETPDYPRREYNINAQPCHIALNCDETLLSVAHQHTDNSPLVRIYKMASLTHQSKNKVVKLTFGPPGTCITDFNWNPVVPDLLSLCVSNGSLCLYYHDDTGKKLNMLPPEKQVTCVSWSPKGKQLLAGDKFGNIVQYKPDLKDPQKVVPPPNDLFPNQCSIVNVIWLSVYQYGVVYMNAQSMETHFSIVNAPKNGPVRYVSYDEICFNSGTVRPHQFYLMHLSAWNILIVASSNSTEVSVLSLLDDKVSWEQWQQEDSTRLDLPTDRNNSETYPVGVTMATCSQLKIRWGENNFLEPMPTLSIVSNDGLVLLFHVINVTPNAAHLCSPATPLADHIFLTQTNPPSQSSNTNTPQVSVVSALPPNFSIPNATVSQGQSPVLEISTRNFSSETPLSLLNKSQISITPVNSQAPKNTLASPATLSHFPQSVQLASDQTQSVPSQKAESQLFQAMSQSIFQTVVAESNATNLPDIPQTPAIPVAPTIVKTNLEKQQLIVAQAPELKKISPKQRTGTIKKEDLELFTNLEEKINQLLKSYKINIGSTGLDVDLTKINDRVDHLENFFSQLEDSTNSLAHDVASMKHALNEALIYAHESKDQLGKYERKMGYEKDPMDGIMITKKAMNPIAEKKLLHIENEIRKSTYFVQTCIQESRPILQHLELVKSGKNLVNFQSILQSINKEKTMISKCSFMLDEINRDVLKMFRKHHILKYPKGSQKERSVDKKDAPTKPIDKFQAIKDQIKVKPNMSNEKLRKLKTLHTTQVLEPIRYSNLNLTNPDRLRTSDLLKVFQSPSKKSQLTPQKFKNKPVLDLIVEKDIENKVTTSVSTPVVSKTKTTVPTALFGVESKPFAVPSPVICEKPEISKNTATFVIDTSNMKAKATKLTFDDSLAAFGSNMTKNMFTSTPAISSATKMPTFAAPTPLAANFGTTFTKVSETSNTQVASKPTFEFSVPSSVPSSCENKTAESAAAPSIFSSGKSMFGSAATTTSTRLSFAGNAPAPFSVSLPSSIPTTSLATDSKSLFPVTVSTSVSTTSTFSFMPSSTPKLSFGSTFTVTTSSTSTSIAPFSISSAPSFGTTSSSTTFTAVSTTSFISTQVKPAATTSTITFGVASTENSVAPSSMFSAPSIGTTSSSTTFTAVSTPSFISTQVKPAATTSTITFGVASTENSVAPSSMSSAPSIGTTSSSTTFSCVSTPSFISTKDKPAATTSTLTFEVLSTKVSQASKFEFGLPPVVASKTTVPEKKTSEQEKSNEMKLEEILSREHPVSATSANVSLGSLMSSTTSKSAFSQDETPSNVKTASASSDISLPTEIKPAAVNGTSSPAFSFGSSSTLFGGAPKSTTSGFSFLGAASKSSTSSTSSSSSSAPTVVATASSSTESISSSISSVSSSSVFGGTTTPSIFGTITKTTIASVIEPPKTTPTASSSATVTPAASGDGVVPTTPTKPVSSDAGPETPSVVEASSSIITPSTPTSAAPFSSLLVTPTTAAEFPPAISSAAPLFGSVPSSEPATTTADIGNMFGKSLSFGGTMAATQVTQASSNVFGQSGGNLFSSSPGGSFGQTSGSIFGKSSTSPSPNLFGQGGSVFGQQTPSTGNVFSKSGSVFGDSSKPANTFGSTASSPFGTQNTTGSFGATSPFGGTGFGSSVKTESSPFFGQSTFGNTPTSSPSVFGAPTTSAGNVFGQSSLGQTSPFSNFGQSVSSTFNNSSGGFGAKSTFGQTGGSIFGGKSAFGSSGGSIFGSGGGNASGGSVFGGSPSFGSSGSAFGQSASFGQAAQQPFGGSAFGAAPSFGSNATFGGVPAFGNTSPTKIFGSNESPSTAPAAASGFGMATTGASQLSFGNLAQQTPQTGFGAFGQAQPSAGSTFGSQATQGFSNPASSGGSFSSWR